MRDVLLVTVDCLRADHVGCYGYSRPTTPNIDAFSSDATLYKYSYANCPGTRWALQSLHMGVSTHQIDGLGLPATAGVTLAEAFSNAGYETFGIADNGFLAHSYGYDRGFDDYHSVEDFSGSRHPLLRVGESLRRTVDNDLFSKYVIEPGYRLFLRFAGNGAGGSVSVTDENTVDIAVSFLESDRERPVFLWVHLMDAHTPYARWDSHLEAIRGDTEIDHVTDPGRQGYVSAGTKPPNAVIDAYDAGIRSADQQIGRLLEILHDDAIVAITGDHGEEFGRYNDFHQASLYRSLTQVPIIIRAPGLPVGTVTDYWAQHLDIPPTLLASADIDRPATWVGQTLQDIERSLDDPIFFDLWDDDHAVRRGDWKLITEADAPPELYHASYGEQETDLINDSAREDELQRALDGHLEFLDTHRIGRASGSLEDERDGLDTDVRESLEDLGYLE